MRYFRLKSSVMKLSTIHAGMFKLDGGAMFGVVPKSMWQSINPPDANNMCTWSMQCLLIEEGNRLILIDTGMGNKQDEKFRSHFYPHGKQSLKDSLAKKGYHVTDITDVILSHLHFDHCGGAVERNNNGNLVCTFPNATYWSHQQHWQWAINPNDREKASFLKENFEQIQQEGRLKFVEKESFQADYISFEYAFGHTEAMITPHIKCGDTTIVFAADLMPSSFHIPMPYVMAYDVRPLITLDEKGKLLQEAVQKKHIIFFEHDPTCEAGTVVMNDKGRIVIENNGSLDALLS